MKIILRISVIMHDFLKFLLAHYSMIRLNIIIICKHFSNLKVCGVLPNVFLCDFISIMNALTFIATQIELHRSKTVAVLCVIKL